MRRLTLIALLLAAPAAAQIISIPLGGPKKVRPSPNADLPGSPAGIEAAVAAPGRPPGMAALDEVRRPAAVLTFLGLPLGARALVVEPEPYYAEIVGTAVGPGGRVTALVDPGSFHDAARRAALAALIGRAPDVTPISGTLATAVLPTQRFGFVLLHLALHGAYAAGAGPMVAARLFASVTPGGIVGVVDNVAAPGAGPEAARDLGRVDPARVIADFTHAGFVLDARSRGLGDARDQTRSVADGVAPSDRFVLRFVRPDG